MTKNTPKSGDCGQKGVKMTPKKGSGTPKSVPGTPPKKNTPFSKKKSTEKLALAAEQAENFWHVSGSTLYIVRSNRHVFGGGSPNPSSGGSKIGVRGGHLRGFWGVKNDPKSPEIPLFEGPKMGPKWGQNDPKMGSK